MKSTPHTRKGIKALLRFAAPGDDKRLPAVRRDALIDALADLRHAAHAFGLDWDEALRVALAHFEAEK